MRSFRSWGQKRLGGSRRVPRQRNQSSSLLRTGEKAEAEAGAEEHPGAKAGGEAGAGAVITAAAGSQKPQMPTPPQNRRETSHGQGTRAALPSKDRGRKAASRRQNNVVSCPGKGHSKEPVWLSTGPNYICIQKCSPPRIPTISLPPTPPIKLGIPRPHCQQDSTSRS